MLVVIFTHGKCKHVDVDVEAKEIPTLFEKGDYQESQRTT
jgi:hypothetical protein